MKAQISLNAKEDRRSVASSILAKMAKVLTHQNTPIVIAFIAVFATMHGAATNNNALYLGSAIISAVSVAWAIYAPINSQKKGETK